MRLLDKYILRNFLVPLLLCLFGFLAIWLVFDLSDHGRDFMEAKVKGRFIVEFYLTQLPQVAMLCLPVGLLLALLYAMSRMSRTNEIIAMLTAGQSLTRLLMPLIGVGLILTGISTWLNYRLAPQAEQTKKEMLDQLGKKRKKDSSLDSQVFRNRMTNRTWFVQRMPANAPDSARMRGLHVTQQDAEGNITNVWYAREGRYVSPEAGWVLDRGKVVEVGKSGDILKDTPFQTLSIPEWKETPWRIGSSQMDAQFLSVDELQAYLHHNGDFPPAQLAPFRTHLQYRWALPWMCLTVVLLAAPLGIVYSRRGVLAGVAGAIFLFAANMLLGYLLLALGSGMRVSPFVAAWGANLLFAAIGLYLLYLRGNNREFPLSLRALRFW